MTDRVEKARALFRSGYNCAQAVFCAFAEELGIDETTALKLSSSFGGGVGRLREVCGAFSGFAMVAGLVNGYDDPNDPEAKKAHYALIQQKAAEFQKLHGSVVCREILKDTNASMTGDPEARTPEYYAARPCERCVIDGAILAEETLLLFHEKKK